MLPKPVSDIDYIDKELRAEILTLVSTEPTTIEALHEHLQKLIHTCDPLKTNRVLKIMLEGELLPLLESCIEKYTDVLSMDSMEELSAKYPNIELSSEQLTALSEYYNDNAVQPLG